MKHDLLDTIIEYAPKLRAAGVQEVSIEGASFKLGAPETASEPATEEEEDELDPLKDPATFGLHGKKARANARRKAGDS